MVAQELRRGVRGGVVRKAMIALRYKNAIGGALGLLLLIAAFGYRWFGHDDGDAPFVPESPGPAQYEAFAAAERAAQLAATTATPTVTPPLTPTASATPTPTAVSTPPAEAEPVASLSELSEEVRAEVDDALTRAQAAMNRNRLLEPEDDSALYWFDAALELDADSAAAKRGRRELLQRMFEAANAAIDGGDNKLAEAVLAALKDDTTSSKEQQALAQRVSAQAQVQDLLRQAAQRMAAGQRFEPDGASALDSYRAALVLDVGNSAAKQGLSEVQGAVLASALAAASADQFDSADRMLALAGSIDAGSQTQLETQTRIVELKSQRAQGLVARIQAALDARDTDTAADLLTRAVGVGADPALLQPLQRRLANARIYDHLNPGEVVSDPFVDRNGTAPALVVIRIGEFQMGSPEREPGRKDSEGPRHTVRVEKPFAFGKTELTVAQFRRFVRAANYVSEAEKAGTSSYYDEPNGRISMGKGVSWKNDYMGEPARDLDPVVHVSFADAQAYVGWLSQATGKAYRLPSEAEFEYVLRAGSDARYWWGEGNPPRGNGNYTGDGDRSPSKRSWSKAFARYNDGFWGPAPVARFAINPFGLYDVDGNVSEWVEDCWHDSYLRAPDTAAAWVNKGCGRRVVRGGSWGSSADQIRSAFRVSSPPEVTSGRVGIRVARDL